MLQRSSICRRNRVSYRRFPFPIILSAVLLILLGAFQGIPEGEAQDAPRVSEVVMNGWRWFHVYCFRCHGMDAVGSQIAPNLRESIKVLPHDEFLRIIREGRPEKGMQAWNVLLDASQMEDIYKYVMERSTGRLKPGRPDEQ
jgi:mono/diheme cytochrome c family protein